MPANETDPAAQGMGRSVTKTAGGDDYLRDQTSINANRYGSAFPEANFDAIMAHLALVRTGNMIGQANARNLMTRFGINAARYSLMRALYFAEGRRLPQSEIAREMNVSSPNVTQLIDALERDSLVERVVNEADRRVTYAQLTAEGLRKCSEMVAATATFMGESCAALSDEEKRTLVQLLGRLRQDLSRRFLDTD